MRCMSADGTSSVQTDNAAAEKNAATALKKVAAAAAKKKKKSKASSDVDVDDSDEVAEDLPSGLASGRPKLNVGRSLPSKPHFL